MKKLLVFLSVILVLTLTVSSFSLFAWALEPVQHPSFNYDNSVWVTLQTEDSCSVEQLQTLLKVETCYIMDKQTKEGTVTYQLVVGKEGESVEATIERMKAVEGVTNAGRNVYAGDYAQKESYLTLNQTELVIPVGGTANLQIVDAKLVQTEQSAVGVMVEVDHEILSYEQFRSIVETYRIWEGMKDAPYVMAFFEDDSEVVWEDMYLHTEYFGWPDEEFLTEERLNNPSPIGKYIIDPYTEHVITYPYLVQELAQVPGITCARIIYTAIVSGIPSHEKWSAEDSQIVGLANDAEDKFDQFYNVTVVGRAVGQTVITVQHGGGSQICYATCTVTVVEANPETPSDVVFGDVTGDRKVDAKDALEVLKASVQKVEFTPLQMLAAEVDGIEGIGARDALEILKYTVKKIDKFPIQQGAETPTDVTPTDG